KNSNTHQPVAVQALGEIYSKFGTRFSDGQDQAAELQALGEMETSPDLLDLGIGQYFDCHPAIVQAAIEALRAGNTRYLTLEPLKEAIVRNYREVHQAQRVSSREVLLLGGARPGMALAALAGIDSGDMVIIPDPDY